MKKTWASVVLAVGCVGVLTNVQAVAQQSPAYVPYAQGALQPASPAAPTGTAADTSPQTPNVTPASANSPTANDPLIDNGLWEGASTGPCCAICGGGSGCPPDWYVEEGVRIFGRSRPRRIYLGYVEVPSTTTTPAFAPALSDRTASPDVSAAYATTIGHYFARDTLNRDNFVEFTYWGLNEWKDSAELKGNSGSLFSGFFFNPTTTQALSGFDNADRQTTFYSSFENNFEINGRISPRSQNDRLVLHPDGRWQRECQPGQYISYLYGLRFMQIDETFRFHSESSATNSTGDYDVVSHNNLLGLQIGADLTFRQCRWAWGVRSRVGAYVNFADEISTITSPDLTADLSDGKHLASLIGEVGFTATYKFRPNLMGRASYDFMWITGLALAPEQIQLTTSPIAKINTNGTIFQQGLSLSLEWMW